MYIYTYTSLTYMYSGQPDDKVGGGRGEYWAAGRHRLYSDKAARNARGYAIRLGKMRKKTKLG